MIPSVKMGVEIGKQDVGVLIMNFATVATGESLAATVMCIGQICLTSLCRDWEISPHTLVYWLLRKKPRDDSAQATATSRPRCRGQVAGFREWWGIFSRSFLVSLRAECTERQSP